MEPQFVLEHQNEKPVILREPKRLNRSEAKMDRPVIRPEASVNDPERFAGDQSPGVARRRECILRYRMATALTAVLLISGSCATLTAQLDLAPREGVYIGEATPFPCIRFRDGAKVARFMPPPKWKFAVDGAGCAFKPMDASQASGSMTVAALEPGTDTKSPERFEKLLTTVVPSGAKDIVSTCTGLPTVRLDSWEARQAQVSYEHFGQKFKGALIIVPLEREELHIRFGCRAADFDRLFTPFFESLGTFTWLTEQEDKATQPAPQGR